LKVNRFLALLFVLFLAFSTIPSQTLAADSVATVEKLVKAAEGQSSKLVKQMSSSNSKDVKLISAQTTSNLNAAISKAKASVSKFKGKQKATFEKRMITVFQTETNVKSYNATITTGNTLNTQLTNFKKTFDSKPFESEKSFTDLKANNDLFTKRLTNFPYKGAKSAFSTKYQTEVNRELKAKKEFFDINKRIGSFINYSKTNEDIDVWDEFYAIDYVIYESLLNEEVQELLYEKWYQTYYPNLVAPEETSINKYVSDFFGAINARDAKAMVELYPTEDEEQKQALEDIFTYTFNQIPEGSTVEITKIELEFVYNDNASVYVELIDSQEGTGIADITTMFLAKVDGKWVFTGDSYEEYFGNE
jgi:hypothetical protein